MVAFMSLLSSAVAQSVLPGFDSSILDRNDDGSTPRTGLGFEVNFFGVNYDSIYVNNNGNVTFDSSLSTYVPFSLLGASRAIVAGFFGDVDTRPSGSGIVTYGPGTYNSHNAFAATWNEVGYFSHGDDKLNTFQVVFVDRSDIAEGDFDIYLRYDQIQWDTASTHPSSAARVGYSNGIDASHEVEGSGVVGALVDGGPNSLSEQGVLVFRVRSGVVVVVDPIIIPPSLLRPLVDYARSRNARRIAAALDAAEAQQIESTLLSILEDILDPEAMAEALESLVPYEAAIPNQILFDGEQRLHRVFDSLSGWAPGVADRLWASPYGAYIDQNRRPHRPGFTYWTGGILIGYDMLSEAAVRIGVAGGYEQSGFSLKSDRGGKGEIRSARLGPYLRTRIDELEIDASLLAGLHFVELDRRTMFGDNHADYLTYSLSGRANLGYRLPVEAVALRPYLGLLYSYLYNESYREDGNLATALAIDSRDDHSLKGEAGLAASHDLALGQQAATVSAVVGYSYEFLYDKQDLRGRFVDTANSDFALRTSTSEQGAVFGGLGVHLPLQENLLLDLEARMTYSDDREQYSGRAVLTWLW